MPAHRPLVPAAVPAAPEGFGQAAVAAALAEELLPTAGVPPQPLRRRLELLGRLLGLLPSDGGGPDGDTILAAVYAVGAAPAGSGRSRFSAGFGALLEEAAGAVAAGRVTAPPLGTEAVAVAELAGMWAGLWRRLFGLAPCQLAAETAAAMVEHGDASYTSAPANSQQPGGCQPPRRTLSLAAPPTITAAAAVCTATVPIEIAAARPASSCPSTRRIYSCSALSQAVPCHADFVGDPLLLFRACRAFWLGGSSGLTQGAAAVVRTRPPLPCWVAVPTCRCHAHPLSSGSQADVLLTLLLQLLEFYLAAAAGQIRAQARHRSADQR